MALETNSCLDELEKKHPKLFFAVYLIVSVLVLLIGIISLIVGIKDLFMPILMIVFGTLGLVCTFLWKTFNNQMKNKE